MSFDIDFSEDAERHLADLRAYARTRIVDEIEVQLTHQPEARSRNRKELKDHPLARWELRVGDWRVFYNVLPDEGVVRITAIGKKVRSGVIIDNKEM